MDLKHREDVIIFILSVILSGIIIYEFGGYYAEFSMYFGWITIFVVHIVIICVLIILILGKFGYRKEKDTKKDITEIK